MAKRIVVAGGGFAGLWAAAAAARLRDRRGAEARLDIRLVAPDPFHTIRVRCYESDLAGIRVPLDDVLGPIGVQRCEARVERIDADRRSLTIRATGGSGQELGYDRLVLASGSAVVPPPIPGLSEHAFDVDTYAGAARLDAHLRALAEGRAQPGRWTAAVLGAGLVGIEIACELPARLAALRAAGSDEPVRVILIERGPEIGADMGAGRPAILAALAALAEAGVETRTGTTIASVDARGINLGNGETIPVGTLICATGLRASPLAEQLAAPRDRLGRLEVDAYLAVENVPGVYAAGDIARAAADDAGHATVMSCQHARPMGRLAGHNAACDLLGVPDERAAFFAPDYVTVLDLGPWGAAYTSGWERGVLVASGEEAKRVKSTINRQRIYPPGGRDAILAAAAPIIQSRPAAPRAT
ncbi:NAD(P)/FAD-dependent oxidoreductase [Methylobacterium gnaphalii]|uniref:NADH dehydrogenase-like protein n=1 Tax=Methylobacterium gnaphalii TaxID=1010610 RepID=A0A512JH47_9HYPH|nr:FAD-dependent oxidoreductase [Methylobacterium gnaphalii]GEP09297.1 NADH dehydrogenase-like protein [Methylobacterium gnaphalii]GJD71042.1 NADH dehydrogenase-like protein [Methylobacterium gnaphalii]GLS48461.1 NADH dehydrogenase [Methylobacterium gnaphalii]